MTFAEKLREVMKEQNLSQSDLSRLTGIGRSSISQNLSGRNIPSPQRQEDIAVALKLPEDYFIGEINAEKELISRAKVKRLTLTETARIMGLSKDILAENIEKGKFSAWAQVLSGKGQKRVFYINAKKFAEAEGVELGV